ncbi:hypothetical protein QR674_06910 [Acinetobacter chinensis]|uniref:Uncharacterized protein n=1 Tax=Acinetobacter chinensis TaxID=2004650 RepID=A0ABU3WE72_9GAMM|nr:hypothetical protein [Acinetobacter chinensis]MDV2468710.1 hypothetical protein [Acinetobacter chinensis]
MSTAQYADYSEQTLSKTRDNPFHFNDQSEVRMIRQLLDSLTIQWMFWQIKDCPFSDLNRKI